MNKWTLFFVVLGGTAAVLAIEMGRPAAHDAPPARPDEVARHEEPSRASTRQAAWSSPPAAATHDGELDDLFARLSEPKQMSAIYFELLERIRTSPAVISKLETMLRTGARNQPAVRLTVAALAGAGTPAAQGALARLVEARRDDAVFLDLLVPTMGFAKHPTAELQGALRKVAHDDRSPEVRQMAHLAIGTSVAQLADEDPSRARAIVAEYDRKLRDNHNVDDTSTYLSVLGNAATPEAAHTVERYLEDPRAEVRDAAVHALRRVPGAEAEAELTQALREDDDPRVRASAAASLSYRSRPSAATLAAEAAILADERDAEIAGRLLANVWAARSDASPSAVAAVTQAAEAHPLAEIREQARQLLAAQ